MSVSIGGFSAPALKIENCAVTYDLVGMDVRVYGYSGPSSVLCLSDYIYCEQREYGWIVREGYNATAENCKPYWCAQLPRFLEQLPSIIAVFESVGNAEQTTILRLGSEAGHYVAKSLVETAR